MAAEVTLSDIYVLSALRLAGHRPLRAVPEGHRTAWVFADTREVREVLRRFYAGELRVDAHAFSEVLRGAKAEAVHLREAVGAPR
jgi:hypothetical protein